MFISFKNHVLQQRASDQFFNDLIFYTPLQEGVGLKNLNSNFVKNFGFWILGKVKRFHFTTFTRLKELANQKNWGARRPTPPPPTPEQNRVKIFINEIEWYHMKAQLHHIKITTIIFFLTDTLTKLRCNELPPPSERSWLTQSQGSCRWPSNEGVDPPSISF